MPGLPHFKVRLANDFLCTVESFVKKSMRKKNKPDGT